MKKLNLSLETLRLLNPSSLGTIQGGLLNDTGACEDPGIIKPISGKASCNACNMTKFECP